jgi:hypothetical protein
LQGIAGNFGLGATVRKFKELFVFVCHPHFTLVLTCSYFFQSLLVLDEDISKELAIACKASGNPRYDGPYALCPSVPDVLQQYLWVAAAKLNCQTTDSKVMEVSKVLLLSYAFTNSMIRLFNIWCSTQMAFRRLI